MHPISRSHSSISPATTAQVFTLPPEMLEPSTGASGPLLFFVLAMLCF